MSAAASMKKKGDHGKFHNLLIVLVSLNGRVQGKGSRDWAKLARLIFPVVLPQGI
jgi:hypothetical protein